MFRRLAIGFALSLVAASAFAASNATTVVTLQPGENVVNLTLPAVAAPAAAAAIKVASESDAVAPIAAPRATCSAYRSRNPLSALTRAYCNQAAASRKH